MVGLISLLSESFEVFYYTDGIFLSFFASKAGSISPETAFRCCHQHGSNNIFSLQAVAAT